MIGRDSQEDSCRGAACRPLVEPGMRSRRGKGKPYAYLLGGKKPMVTTDIREFAYGACQRRENVLTASFFDWHLAVVAEYAGRLAAHLSADAEIVQLAAYLHDISAVFDFTTMPNHRKLSAQFATRELLERGYPRDRACIVARAIASHSDPLPIGSASPEEICISNADAVARIVRPAYWLYFASEIRKYGFEDGRRWLRSLIERQWSALIEPAKQLVGERYSGTMNFLAGRYSLL